MKYLPSTNMTNSQLITDPFQDDESLSERSFEETVKVVCCRPREDDLLHSEQPPAKKRKQSKKVRIVEQENELYYRPYDKEEMKSAWMSDKDFRAIKEGNRETLITILKSCGEMSKVDANECCLRGLESHIEMFYTKSKRDGHKKIIQRVLADQKAMRAFGVDNPEMLGKVYGELSQQATRRALNLALIDALA